MALEVLGAVYYWFRERLSADQCRSLVVCITMRYTRVRKKMNMDRIQ